MFESRLGLLPSVNTNHRLVRVAAGSLRLSDEDSTATLPVVVTLAVSSCDHSPAFMIAAVDVPKSKMLPLRDHTRTGNQLLPAV